MGRSSPYGIGATSLQICLQTWTVAVVSSVNERRGCFGRHPGNTANSTLVKSLQAIWLAERKPYQLAIAARLGFTLPRTIVTNDEAAVKGFALENRLVAKAVSSGYIKGTDGNRAIFTSALASDDIEDLSGLALAPVIFQREGSEIL